MSTSDYIQIARKTKQKGSNVNIILIGAGNLATNLGKALFNANHKILQVYSRTAESANSLAKILKSEPVTDFSKLRNDADIYILAVKDSVLEEVAEQVVKGREGRMFVHTAGSMPMSVIHADRAGVFYPMQTFSKYKEVDFTVIPCFVEVSYKPDLIMLKMLASTISDTIYELNSENRKYLHLSAVFCCNFVNHCYAMGAQLLKEHGNLPFSVMLPLIEETASKLHYLSPKEAQTGPAIRWDENVINKQMDLLSENPNMKQIYQLLSQSIHDDQL